MNCLCINGTFVELDSYMVVPQENILVLGRHIQNTWGIWGCDFCNLV